MDRTYIITVGTGRNEKDRINIAKGFATLLGDMHPDKIIFIGSEESKNTVEDIKNEYYEAEIIRNIGDYLKEDSFYKKLPTKKILKLLMQLLCLTELQAEER